MERLIEYATHHPWLATAAVAVAALVIVYEMRARSESLVSISPQDVVRLMNQGALLIDLRPQEEYKSGHVAGARQMSGDQNPSSCLQRLGVSSFAKRVFDLGLAIVVARFWIEGGSRSNNPLRASKLSCSASDGSNTFGGEFPRGRFNDVDTSGEHFIAILHHVDDVHVAAPF